MVDGSLAGSLKQALTIYCDSLQHGQLSAGQTATKLNQFGDVIII